LKISILTPSYNSGKYLEHAIKSILKQDYENWEHIIIDGGSTDNTMSVLDKHPHLIWISEPDKGIYDAMNKGIKMAEGDLIYFMGADDELLPGTLKRIVDETEDSEFDVIYGDVWSSRFGGRYGGEFNKQRLYQNNICHQSIFFRKNLFEDVGDFNLKYKSHADWDHNLRWLLNKKINYKYVDCVISKYADGGYSSINFDTVFARDKRYNYIKYGWKNVPDIFIEKLCKQEIKAKNLFLHRKFFSLIVYLLSRILSI
jgi:glycosyltransferase involved in cell wall biosynthesis